MIVIPTAASILLSLLLAAAPAAAQDGAGADAGEKPEMAHAVLQDPKGNDVGWVRLDETPNGVLVHARFSGVPQGVHAFHVHQIGKCDPPSFESAGGHYNPTDHKHGFEVEGGPHLGDMPNVDVPEAGNLEVDVFADGLSVRGKNALLDDDGSAIIVHQGQDDYSSQPSGDAGSRIACGVVKAGAMTGAAGKAVK